MPGILPARTQPHNSLLRQRSLDLTSVMLQAIAILDIAENAVKDLKARCKPDSDRIIFIKCDVADEANLTKAFEQVLATVKRLDVIINCAGIMDDSPGQWSKSCDINLVNEFAIVNV